MAPDPIQLTFFNTDHKGGEMMRRLLICIALLITCISIVWFRQVIIGRFVFNTSEFILQLLLVTIEALIYSSVLYFFVRELEGRIRKKGLWSLLFALAFLTSTSFRASNLERVAKVDKFNEALLDITSGKTSESPSQVSYTKEVYGDFAPVLELTKIAVKYPWQELEHLTMQIEKMGLGYFLSPENILNYHYLMGSIAKVEELISVIEPSKSRIRNQMAEVEIQAKILEIKNQGVTEEFLNFFKIGNANRITVAEQIFDLHKKILLETKGLLVFLSRTHGSYWLENELLAFPDDVMVSTYNESLYRLTTLRGELNELLKTVINHDKELQTQIQYSCSS